MPSNGRLPKGLFSTGLDDIVEKLLKSAAPAPNEPEMRLELARRGLAAAEALVLAPKVTFKVYGENVVLAVLAKAIGPKGIRELLEEGAVEFTLWQSFPVYWSETPGKPMPKGVHPLAGMTLTSEPHRDPFASAELGLRGWAPWMLPSDAKPIARLAAERTSVVDAKSGDIACRKVLAAYEAGLLLPRGFDGSIAYDEMTDAQRSQLAAIASDLHRVAVAFGQELDVHEDEGGWSALTAACARLQAPERVVEVGERVIRLERIPSISQLLLFQVLSHADIPSLRRRKETKEFRKWLWSQPDPTDAAKVSEAYLAEMAPRVDLKDKRWFKAARISVVGALGSALGTVAAGPVGGAIGAAVASTAAGIATSMVDGFWLDALLAKPNPRRLVTDVLMPLISSRTQPMPALGHADEGGTTKPSPDDGTSDVGATYGSTTAHAPSSATSSQREGPSDDEARRRERNKRKTRRKAQRNARRRAR
jgi:hypothetical protein